MPVLSKKGQAMPASPIRKLVPYAEAAKKHGIEVIHLNIGQPDIKTPEAALDAVRKAPIEVLEYSRSEGNESYRIKLSGYYARHGISVNPEQILVTTGGSEALSILMGCIADPGDEVIIPEPFYANYNGFAIANGVKVVPIASDISDNFALPPIET
ncbi:MAG: aminotransferase class I/II-fold pyridoxal phosphate-dependent enzyme, partial [Robiginitalea sp.]